MNQEEIKNYIKTYFQYNKIDGIITRTDRKNSNGSYDKDGYLIIKIKGKQFKAHRIAWLLHYGEFPKKEIDHINRNRKDNRIVNLRECTRQENINNTTKKINKDTGVIGVYLDKYTKGLKAKYTFRINGKNYRYRTLEKAIEMREKLR